MVWLNLNGLSALVPDRKTMVEAQRELGCLIHRHLMFILASKLGKGTDALVNPLVAVDLLSTTGLGRGNGRCSCLSDNGIDLHLLRSVEAISTRPYSSLPESHRHAEIGELQELEESGRSTKCQ